MVEHGLYIIKKDFLELIKNLGGDCDYYSGDKRPIYCCMKDKRIEGLYWAIPTSDIKHRSDGQQAYYEKCLERPSNDLRSCYYHIGKTTKEALYKVSSCFPITEKYIEREFLTCGRHVIIKRAETVNELERKLKRILSFEARNANYFAQHITDIKNYLIKELEQERIEKEEELINEAMKLIILNQEVPAELADQVKKITSRGSNNFSNTGI